MEIDNYYNSFYKELNTDRNTENRRRKLCNQYYCITCGKEKDELRYSNCYSCYMAYLHEQKYERCLRCGNPKYYDYRGLCLECYHMIKEKNYLKKAKENILNVII